MRTIKSKISALVLGVCLLASLALGGVAALAAVSMNNGTVTVSVSKSTDATFVDDLKTAPVKVDLFKVADATPNPQFDTYDYTLDSRLGKTMQDYYQSDTHEYDWEALSADAAEKLIPSTSPVKTATKAAGAMDVTFTGLADGIYLVYAHGDQEFTDMHGNKTDEMARSAYYMYRFTPYVVALPTKAADEDGVARTDDSYGAWLDEVEVGLKPSRYPRYGALKINKVIDGDASDEDSTFVFHIWGKTKRGVGDPGEDYDNYASITIPAGELTGETIVDHIPAGTEINIEEIYTAGTRYKMKSLSPTTGIIIADDNDNDTGYHLIEFTCVNEPGEDIYGGHGVENNFRYNKNDDDRWGHTPTPEDKVVGNEGDLIKQ